MITKPMLAETCDDIANVKFPVIASPKLDGIRCLIVGGKALTRSFKPIPNKYIRARLEACFQNNRLCFDGELLIPTATFNEVQSGIMSHDGQPDFEYHIFDVVDNLKQPYTDRLTKLYMCELPNCAKRVDTLRCDSAQELALFETECLGKGYEGVMIRTLTSPYKCGR